MVRHKQEIWLPAYKTMEIFLFWLRSAGNQKTSRSCDSFIFQATFILESFCSSTDQENSVGNERKEKARSMVTFTK